MNKIIKTNTFLSIIDKIVNGYDLLDKENEQFNEYSNDLDAVYAINNPLELNNLIHKVIEQFGNKVNLNWIDVSGIIYMSNMFATDSIGWVPANFLDNSEFNGDISKWDVSNVKDMSGMFLKSKFNGDISEWNITALENMDHMFCDSEFDGDLSGWDVSNVKNMDSLFLGSIFNRNISSWNVSNVENMKCMFSHSKFNKDISKWDISRVKEYYKIFYDCPIKEEYKPKFKI